MKLLYRFVKWAFSRGTLPYWCVFAYDTLSVLVSGLFVYTLQYGVDNLYTNLNRVGLGIGLCMVLYMVAFFIFHTFNGVLRYSSFIDLRRVAYSSFTASIAICVFHQLQIHFGLTSYILVPRFVSGVQLFITATMLMWTARMAAKALHDLYNNFGISKNVFIYGAQSGAVALARSIVSDPSSRYKIKGFISDNEMMTSSRISGIKVYEDSPELVETMRKLHVQALLVCGKDSVVDGVAGGFVHGEHGIRILHIAVPVLIAAVRHSGEQPVFAVHDRNVPHDIFAAENHTGVCFNAVVFADHAVDLCFDLHCCTSIFCFTTRKR